MKFLMIITLLSVSACTITVKPLPKPYKAVKHRATPYKKHHVAQKHRQPSEFSNVSKEWLDKYVQLEKEHGNYFIPEDHRIESVGEGYRVPKAVMDHYHDLIYASPSPTP
jgi:cytochrome c biogenesis protein ResB